MIKVGQFRIAKSTTIESIVDVAVDFDYAIIVRIPTKPIMHSNLMPITYGAKRRRALSVWNIDRHQSTVFCLSSHLRHSFSSL